MRYKIINFFGDNFYCEDKKELFEFIDCCLKNSYRSFGSFFSEEFLVTNNFCTKEIRQVFLIETIEFDNKFSIEKEESVWVNAHFNILDEKSFQVDLNKIEKEYLQSRKLGEKKRKPYSYVPGSKSLWRGRKGVNGLVSELRDNFIADEFDIKLRSKRRNKVEEINADLRYSYRRSYSSGKDWKRNKRKHQWK